MAGPNLQNSLFFKILRTQSFLAIASCLVNLGQLEDNAPPPHPIA